MEAMSLDEYIRKKSMGDQFTLLNHRKRDRNIEKEDLDLDLDEYIREARVEGMDEDVNMEGDTSCGKFNRPSMQDDGNSSGDENELDIKLASLNTTAFIKEEEEDSSDDVKEEEEPNFNFDGPLKSFRTAESREGIRVRSQHFRLLPENLVDRPVGMKRLLPMPLDESERYKRRVLNGRVHKRNDSRATSSTSFASGLTNISSSGKYFEKGKFSYKVGERGFLGIDRVRRGPQLQSRSQAPPSSFMQASSSGTGININMDWNGLFEGMTKFADKLANPAAAPPSVVEQTNGDELSHAANKLLQVLKAKNYFANRAVDVSNI